MIQKTKTDSDVKDVIARLTQNQTLEMERRFAYISAFVRYEYSIARNTHPDLVLDQIKRIGLNKTSRRTNQWRWRHT